MNSINYNSQYDQIILSVRGNSEIWVIDHSTTTAEAAGHTGGRYGKGGDLLYRWGNPVCYKLGNASDQKLFQQHDAEWIDSLCPGAGNITVFNNGVGRNYSSADQFAPPIDSLGFYYRAPGTAFGPTSLAWTYTATPPTSFYSSSISGVQRLPNGNTLISAGVNGTFFEVTSSGETIWRYVNPVTNTGPLHWNDSIPRDPNNTGTLANMVFKVHRYSPAYEGFVGRDLTPGDYVELYQTGVEDEVSQLPSSFKLDQNYPNPFNPSTAIRYELPTSSFVTLTIHNILGQQVAQLVNEQQQAGYHETGFRGDGFASGVFFCRIQAGDFVASKKLLLLK